MNPAETCPMGTVLENYLDELGRIHTWPSSRRKVAQRAALKHISTKFDPEVKYSEKEVNEVIRSWHTFDNHALVRRELICQSLMNRKNDGSEYWLLNQ